MTPVGKVFETRIAMMKSDTEMVTNGEPGGKIVHYKVGNFILKFILQVVAGKPSLVNVPGYPRCPLASTRWTTPPPCP